MGGTGILDNGATRKALRRAWDSGGPDAASDALLGAIAALTDVETSMMAGCCTKEQVVEAIERLYGRRDGDR